MRPIGRAHRPKKDRENWEKYGWPRTHLKIGLHRQMPEDDLLRSDLNADVQKIDRV